MRKLRNKVAACCLLGLVAGNAQVQAEEYAYLTVTKSNGAAQSYALENLKLTFADGNLLVHGPQGVQTLPLSELSRMYFNSQQVGIRPATGTTDAGSVKLTAGDRVRITAATGTPVQLIDAAGSVVKRLTMNEQTVELDLSGLPDGIYLVRTPRGTVKIKKG